MNSLYTNKNWNYPVDVGHCGGDECKIVIKFEQGKVSAELTLNDVILLGTSEFNTARTNIVGSELKILACNAIDLLDYNPVPIIEAGYLLKLSLPTGDNKLALVNYSDDGELIAYHQGYTVAVNELLRGDNKTSCILNEVYGRTSREYIGEVSREHRKLIWRRRGNEI